MRSGGIFQAIILIQGCAKTNPPNADPSLTSKSTEIPSHDEVAQAGKNGVYNDIKAQLKRYYEGIGLFTLPAGTSNRIDLASAFAARRDSVISSSIDNELGKLVDDLFVRLNRRNKSRLSLVSQTVNRSMAFLRSVEVLPIIRKVYGENQAMVFDTSLRNRVVEHGFDGREAGIPSVAFLHTAELLESFFKRDRDPHEKVPWMRAIEILEKTPVLLRMRLLHTGFDADLLNVLEKLLRVCDVMPDDIKCLEGLISYEQGVDIFLATFDLDKARNSLFHTWETCQDLFNRNRALAENESRVVSVA